MNRLLTLPLLIFIPAVSAVAQSRSTTQPAPNQFIPQQDLRKSAPARTDHSQDTASLLALNPKPLCYTMRSYQFSQDDAGSGHTRLTGYSTCQSSVQLRTKTTVDERPR